MDAFEIQSPRLKVRISAPGAHYKGSRFDWTGFVTQVTFDDAHRFCVDESLVPGKGSGGRGLCNEFGIQAPVGYDDAKVGEGFPKLGTGILTKTDDEPYNFFKPYPVEPYPCKVRHHESEIVFSTKPVDCNGYSYELIKTLKVDDSRLSVGYILKNTGTKTIETNEYIHNFVSIDKKDIGPDYKLSFSFTPKGEGIPEIFNVKDNAITWKYVPTDEFYWAPEGYRDEQYAWWELIDQKSGVGLRETSSFTPERVAIWGKTHVVSPEMFIKIALIPGETMEWERQYEFFKI